MSEPKVIVRQALCEAIAATLRRSGREVPQFKDTDKPVKTYDGFDSQCGVEVTVELEEMLGADDLGNNVFVKGTGKTTCARSLSEIVKEILAKMRTNRGRA